MLNNTFNVKIRINNAWENLTGTTIFPLDYCNLLDERLDEAYLSVVNDTNKYYRPNQLLKIEITNDSEQVTKYFLTARDDSVELPVGSGKYKHKLYLIEPTKELEGVICQSLTFTNQKSELYLENANPVEGTIEDKNGNVWDDPSPFPLPAGYSDIVSPISSDVGTVLFPSLKEVLDEINPYKDVYNRYNNETTTVTFSKNGVVSYSASSPDYATPAFSTFENQKYSFSIDQSDTFYTVEYVIAWIVAEAGTKAYGVYRVTYSFFATRDKYAPKQITVKDAVDRVLDLAIPLFDIQTNAGWTNAVPKYKLDPAQTAWLDGILANEVTMTQCTLREQLQVIGSFIHAEPRLMLAEGEHNTIERYIHFDEYGNTELSSVSDASPYVYQSYNYSINEYCTNVDTTASNIVNALDYAKGVIAMPDRQNYKTLRTESVNVRLTEGNMLIPTTFPIYEVSDVLCGVYDGNGGFAIDPVSIAPYIFESTSYFANLSSYKGGYPRSKSYALYYTIGQKNIQGLFFKPETLASNVLSPYLEYYAIVNILSAATGRSARSVRSIIEDSGGGEDGYKNLAFRVVYTPIYQTRFSAGKPYVDEGDTNEYTRIYNQSENVIEARYYGEHIKGVAARLGNVEQTRTYQFNALSQVPKVGSIMETDDGSFAISAVSVEIQPHAIKCTVALTKDFNRISQYIGVNSVKRVYEVSERQASARSILLKEYCVIGNVLITAKRDHIIAKDAYAVASAFLRDGTPKINAVQAQGRKKEHNGSQERLAAVSLPVVASAFGNAMTFSWNYKDNYSAGETLSDETESGITGYWQQDLAYCDYFGRIYQYFFSLRNTVTDLGYSFALKAPEINGVEYGYPADATLQTRGFLTAKYDANAGAWYDTPYLMRKDSRESPNFTYCLEFVANQKDLVIGSALAATCNLVAGTPQESGNTRAEVMPHLYFIGRRKEQFGGNPSENPPFRIGKFQKKLPDLTGSTQYQLLDYGTADVFVSLDGAYYFRLSIPGETFVTMIHDTWVFATPKKTVTQTVTDDSGQEIQQTLTTGGDILLAGSVQYDASNVAQNRTIYFSLVQEL